MAISSSHRTLRAASWLVITSTSLLGISTTALGQGAEPEPLPQPGTVLEAGRYSSSVVGPTIEFRADESWLAGPAPDGPIFMLARRDEPGTYLSVTRFDGDAYLDSCDPSSLTSVEATVPRLAEIIAGNPYLNPGPVSSVEVDGFTGLQLDVATPFYSECDQELLVWALPMAKDPQFMQVADQQSRFVILDVAGDVIVIAIESFPGVPFGGLLEASMDLLDSMRIEPGEYVPAEPTEEATTPGASDTPAAAGSSPSPAPSGGADATA